MASNCSFDLKVTGEESAVKEFINVLEFDPDYGYSHFGWVYSFEVQDWMTERRPDKPGLFVMGGVGDCPYSIKYAMRDGAKYESLEAISKRLGLVIEAFSSEPDNGIQEHFLVNHGNVLVDECKDDYREYVIDGATEVYIHDVAEENDLTEEELFSKVNVNGEFCVGGFENYGDFEDHFAYFQTETMKEVKAELQIVDSFVSEDHASIYSVSLAHGYFVDVKVFDNSSLIYVMENHDGSTVYGMAGPEAPIPNYNYDEASVIKFVKDFHEKKKDFDCFQTAIHKGTQKPSLDEQIRFASYRVSETKRETDPREKDALGR